ncbi:hypothetical protein CRE_06760 [Caenorhabditis remanei]|uniref:NTF2-like domain-containing protein n=1 Tax=Caenorhabditis remanei TaxID=31234 RepID=E3MNZ7_CAERE|nr:hypothetical protein CRE_06760 [Caenorhabditis remanei]
MQSVVLLLLLVLYGSAFEMHETPRLVGNLDYDGSEKQVEKWLDSFHKAARSGDRHQIASHFADEVHMMTCDGGPSRFERTRFNRTTIIDYLVAHGSNVVVKLLESTRSDRRPIHKQVNIWTELVVTGIGKPFSPMVNFFVVNGTLLFFGGEMTYCGYGRPSESTGDGSMSVAYDFLESFARAMRNRTDTTAIAEHFSNDWTIKDYNRRGECTKVWRDETVHYLSTFKPYHSISFLINLENSYYVDDSRDVIKLEASMYNLKPFSDGKVNSTIIMIDGKFKWVDSEHSC